MPSVFSELTALARKIHEGDRGIRAEEFLTVCRQIIPITEKFGTSFALIKSDLNGNITRLETARQKSPWQFELLFPIILDEVERGKQGETYSDARGLLWLKRAMEFIDALLERLFDDRSIAMTTAASEAYTATLYQYHTWYTAAAFTVALKLVPSRETFFKTLDCTDELAMSEMKQFLQTFHPTLVEIQQFLKQHNLDDPTRV